MTIETILAADSRNTFDIYPTRGGMLQCCLRVWNGRRMVQHVSNCSDRQRLIEHSIDWYRWLEPEYEEREKVLTIDGRKVKFYTLDGMWTSEYLRESEAGMDFVKTYATLEKAIAAVESLFVPGSPEEIKKALALYRRKKLTSS